LQGLVASDADTKPNTAAAQRPRRINPHQVNGKQGRNER